MCTALGGINPFGIGRLSLCIGSVNGYELQLRKMFILGFCDFKNALFPRWEPTSCRCPNLISLFRQIFNYFATLLVGNCCSMVT